MWQLPILLAYPYMKGAATLDILRKHRGSYRLIVDSGAFTAWRSGKPIELKDYCAFLDSIRDLQPFHAVQLDVFGKPQQTYDNFLRMRAAGYEVMPVFTRGESFDRLDEFYAHSPYLMFGGITTGENNRAYVNAFMARNKGRAVHLLGFTDLDYIKAYKPTSVDASSWRSAHRWGSLAYYAGFGAVKTISRLRFDAQPPPHVIEALRGSGATPDMIASLAKQAAWKNTAKFARGAHESAAAFVSTLSHITRSYEVEKHTGTAFYLACPGGTHLLDLLRAFTHWQQFSSHGRTA